MDKKYYVFVYGTLMSGQGNHILLSDAEFIGEATIKDKTLYDLPYGFPAVIDGENEVRGEVYKVSEEELKSLDRLEGYSRSFPSQSLYIRCWDVAYLDNGKTLDVFYYHFNKEIPHGAVELPSGVKWGRVRRDF